MLIAVLTAAVLVAVTVFVHAIGLAAVLRAVMKSHATPPIKPWAITWLLIQTTWWLLLIHVAEISIWALFFSWCGCLPDAESAFYFSGVTYATIGYGDVVLPQPWRLLGPIEGLTGILMCGLSAGVFFALVSRIYTARGETKRK